jgi:hypothetical protein
MGRGSQRLDPLLRGQTERFGDGRTVRSLWGLIVTICKCLWGEALVSDGAGRSATVSKQGWPHHQGTYILDELLQGPAIDGVKNLSFN